MTDPSKLDWVDTTIGAIGGAFTAVVGLFGWFGKKLHAVNVRIDTLEKAASACLVHQGVQAQQHHENLRRLGSIEQGILRIDDKQDKQMTLLVAMKTEPRQEH